MLKEYILIPEENKRNMLPYKDALVNLAVTNAPYKTKKRILVQEGRWFYSRPIGTCCYKPRMFDAIKEETKL